ncbi:Aste57867_17102 [Aphanomyces stellatus]|uniref:Aste57867_17102 protein n=1 Tax=Aphanomyces stellatus TaxID=120398 RepID=A0A485L8H5_9STRA|nr:hypothetical protein As57867_017043 [Aphanomyces stellatus]VFT93860.1 Aste57867_17102 [Aphanomyces stellatus]
MANAFVALESPPAAADAALNPLETVSWLSYITLGWMTPLYRKGAATPLTEDDVWPLASADTAANLHATLMGQWNAKTELHRAIWTAFRGRIITSFVIYGVYACASLLQPLVIKSMLQFLQQEQPAISTALGISSGYGLAALLLVTSMVSATLMDFAGFYTAHLGVNVKSALAHAVYLKTLAISGLTKQQFSSGEVITMNSVDSERICFGFTVGLWTFISPVLLLAIFILLGFQLDFVSALGGGIAMAAFLLFGFLSGNTIGNLRRAILTLQAERVKLTNEVLQGIRVVKLYAWELPMQHQLHEIRLRELAFLKQYHALRIANVVLLMVAPVVSLAVSLMVFVARGSPLTTATAFTALALMNITRQPCGIFSLAVVGFTEAMASCHRLTKYLHADEIAKNNVPSTPSQIKQLELFNADFSWDNDPTRRTLKQINFKVVPNTLTVVVGTVGSGKSSLLSAILGDIHLTGGSRDVQARFSYVNQESWIQHATVKQNITFESPLDEELYNRVISACQLSPDLEMMPKGDATEIGERGINLSGGQKARISLARAMYHQEADVYLLDDPLSALDVHVANAVFTDCMQGLLRGKTTLLVLASHYHLLPYADRIILMSEGSIVGDGTYDELKTDFPHLMNFTHKELAPVSLGEELKDVVKLDKREDALVAKEDQVKGKVTGASYKAYLGASGYSGHVLAFVISALFILSQAALALTDWLMAVWAKNHSTSLSFGWAYVGLAGASVVLVYARSIFVLFTAMLCSKNFHARVLASVLNAPVPTFFDVTPVGRILNRFSADLDQIDTTLPHFGLTFLQNYFNVLAVCVVCAITTPWILAFFVPVAALYFFLQRSYNATVNEIKRMDGVTRSPLISLVSETYQGLATIRAFDKSAHFATKQRTAVDYNMRFNFFASDIGARWFQLRLDILGSVIVAGVAFLAVATKSSIGLTAAGLALTYSTQLSVLLTRMAVFYSWMDSAMTCVERLNHYTSLDSEDNTEDNQVIDWPSKGAIELESYSMRYREHLDLVLNQVSFTVQPGHQVGICGRTGSGKSSLMAALFRMVPAATGRITIDGVDIASVSVTTLRSGLTIIPQDPVLFSGSIRLNLDPTNEASDADLWTAVKQAHLGDAIPSLEFEIAEKGSNLSVGQRQLVCIARALLRRSKVVVLDEATANIDPESDRLIQQTMRECFHDVTRLIIAHRLDTILDSDRILVLDAGVVKEYDAPSVLLANKEGAFAQLAQHAHIDLAKRIVL